MKRFLFFSFIFLKTIAFSQFQFNWVKGTSPYPSNNSSKSDVKEADNFIYTVGQYSGTCTFGVSPNVISMQSSGHSVYITKHDTSGGVIWAKEFKTLATYNFSKPKIAIKGQYIYVTGCLRDSMDFDPSSSDYKLYNPDSHLNSQNNLDLFICKLDTAGNFVWAKNVGGIDRLEPSAIEIDANGNVVVGGYFKDSVDFDSGMNEFILVANSVMPQPFITICDSLGNFIKAGQFMEGAPTSAYIKSMCIDTQGNIIVTGEYVGQGDFDPGIGQSILLNQIGDNQNVFVCKLNNSLDLIWAKKLDGTQYLDARCIVSDTLNNIYVCGNYNGTLDMNPGNAINNHVSVGLADCFIVKLKSSGDYIWGKSIGGSYYENFFKILITDFGTINVIGMFQVACDFDPGPGVFNLSTVPSSNTTHYDIFLASYDINGNLISANSIGSPELDDVSGICIDRNRAVYLIGQVFDAVDFDFSSNQHLFGDNLGTKYFFVKYLPGMCPTFAAVIDVVNNITCTNIGYASAHAINGQAPYSYDWSMVEDSNQVFATFVYPGIYELTVTDSLGCSDVKNILVSGPDTSMADKMDLKTTIFASEFKTGFSAQVQINAFNNGCVPANGFLKVVVSPLLLIDSIVPLQDDIIGDTLVWDLSNLVYGVLFNPKMYAHTSTSASIGDEICIVSKVNTTSDDINLENNIGYYCSDVINAYDPNIKTVFPQGQCTDKYILKDEDLTYTIQFQNTGNTAATNVYIIDTLDYSLNIESVNILEASHTMITEVLPGNALKFVFNNIMLEDSTSNEPASHGYVTFVVTPNVNAIEGDVVTNTSYIYFDFNEAVVTNTTANKIVSVIPNCTVALDYFTEVDDVNVFPNPCGNNLLFKFKDNKIRSVKFFSLQGEEVYAFKCDQEECKLNIEELPIGFYTIIISQDEITKSFKLIKMNN